jgi:hypothetical protein
VTYEKPKCDCGRELMVSEMVSFEKFYNIKKDGKPCKKPNDTTKGFIQEGNLWCSKCCETYAIDYDEKDRLIRSDKVS